MIPYLQGFPVYYVKYTVRNKTGCIVYVQSKYMYHVTCTYTRVFCFLFNTVLFIVVGVFMCTSWAARRLEFIIRCCLIYAPAMFALLLSVRQFAYDSVSFLSFEHYCRVSVKNCNHVGRENLHTNQQLTLPDIFNRNMYSFFLQCGDATRTVDRRDSQPSA